jgi:3-isopropylmalate dehydrogenase
MKLLVLDGDGIGPEVNAQALRVLDAVAQKTDGLSFEVEHELFGGASLDEHGIPLTDEVVRKAKASDAVLLGAVGGPKWDDVEPERRAERGLLRIRKELGVYANLRPAKFYDCLTASGPLRPERSSGADFVVVRELVSGIYFGEPRGIAADGESGVNSLTYTADEVRRVGRIAFDIAKKRGGRLTSVDKANVLEVMRMWRNTMVKLRDDEFPDVELEHAYVDAFAMTLVTRPKSCDVIVTGNMFGDILSDIAAALTGSLGMLPSASLGDGTGIYEPVHGSAPDIAGEGKANPLGAILSAALLLEHAVERVDLADKVRDAVESTLDDGLRTGDIMTDDGNARLVGTDEMGDTVIAKLNERL